MRVWPSAKREKSPRKGPRWAALRALIAGLILGFLTHAAQAEGVTLMDARVTVADDIPQVNLHYGCSLNPTLEDVLVQGVALPFVVDLEVVRKRNFWFDSIVAKQQRTVKLSYYSLTRQYRLNFGGLPLNFSRLSAALDVMCNVRNWPINSAVRPESGLTTRVRLQLDQKQLPRLFQLSALTSSDWSLDSGWQSFPFVLSDGGTP